MLASHEQVRLRKRLLSILRQNSEYVQLYYDTYGYTPVEQLLAYLRTLKGCGTTTRSDLREVVESDQGQVFEWDQGALIRVKHGFMPAGKKGRLEEVAPPDILYYGTHRKLVRQVMAGGLFPIASEFVQLAQRVEEIGLPHDTLALVVVRASDAYQAGVRFYQACSPSALENSFFFSDAISPSYLETI